MNVILFNPVNVYVTSDASTCTGILERETGSEMANGLPVGKLLVPKTPECSYINAYVFAVVSPLDLDK